jgi:hypothetical protein
MKKAVASPNDEKILVFGDHFKRSIGGVNHSILR